MRSAPCAWAPSHTLHAMPPRITRNSHRPRASDRTMVDLEHQFGLPLFRTRWHRHHPRRKLMSMGNRPSFSREAQFQWAGSRETNLASGRGRTFFLTSLFIELIDRGRWPVRVNECNRLWLLKNSHSRSSQKFHRARMPYKRRSRFWWTFSTPRLGQFFQERGFFNSHA